MGFSKNDQTSIAVLGPQGKPTDGTTPMLYASNIKKARAVLGSRGVNVGEIQQDQQGAHYFEMRDLEGRRHRGFRGAIGTGPHANADNLRRSAGHRKNHDLPSN